MTDYFALLDQTRSPWLDAEKLKQAFHSKTLREHPDAQAQDGNQRDAEATFSELNEAYQVLRDPKRRLHHLLTLQGEPPSSRSASVPREIEELFSAIALLNGEAEALSGKLAKASGALSRSLLKRELVATLKKIDEALTTLSRGQKDALVRLEGATADDSAELHALYLRFSYLGRWITELQEKQLRLRM